jgi:hypothetical protein
VNAAGTITGQNFVANGMGAGTSDWVAGMPLLLCTSSSGTQPQPCIQTNSFFLQAPPSPITSFGWTAPVMSNPLAGPLIVGPAAPATGGYPVTSALSVGYLTDTTIAPLTTQPTLATVTGTLTTGHLASFFNPSGSNYDLVDSLIPIITCGAAACINSPLSALVSATAIDTINNASYPQTWNWALSGSSSVTGFTFGESAAATGTGARTLLAIQTAATSTTTPLQVTAQGAANGVQMTSTGLLQPIGAGGITATGVPWSGLTAPMASLSFTHPVGDTTSMTWAGQSTNVTDWLWTEGADTGSPVSNAFSFIDTTGNTRTGALLNVNTVGTSTALPIQITAQGTANGVDMTSLGLLQAIGSGGINATELNGNTYPALAGFIQGGLLCATSTTVMGATSPVPAGQVAFGGTSGNCPTATANLKFSSPTLTIGVPGTTTGILALASSTATGGVSLESASASSTFTATFPATTGTVSLMKAQACGTTSSCSATTESSPMVVYGSAPLVSGSPSTVTISGISPTFASSTSYVCTVSARSTATGPLSVTNVSSSSFTITGPNTVTTVINYTCVGT